MAKQGGGAIVNNASIQALKAVLGADAYSAAKGGIVSLTRIMAAEWARHNIRVDTICPRSIGTPMIATLLDDPAERERLTASTALRRIGRPEETAMAALLLASDEASYITGAILPVDGGMAVL